MFRRTIPNSIRHAGSRWPSVDRRGAFLVEFALVVPVVFALIFMFIEFGRYSLVRNAMDEAARVGCRKAILKDSTDTEIESEVTGMLSPFGISRESIAISDRTVCQGDPVTVTVSVQYHDVSWLPMANFIGDHTIKVSCTLPQEADECSK